MDNETRDALKEVLAYAYLYLATILDEMGDCEETASLDNSLTIVNGMLISHEAAEFLLTASSEGGTI